MAFLDLCAPPRWFGAPSLITWGGAFLGGSISPLAGLHSTLDLGSVDLGGALSGIRSRRLGRPCLSPQRDSGADAFSACA